MGIYNAAAWNAMQVEEVSLLDFNFEEMLADDMDTVEWDKDEDMDSDGFELVFKSPVWSGYWVPMGANWDRDRLACAQKPKITEPNRY